MQIDVGPLPPGLHVRADESELQHALINLVLNAVQACRPGGHVTLTAERDELLRLRVTDDGCGIPADQRKRIFEPFLSLRKGGSGLGLFLSLNFVRRWGGDIAVESEPGRGSTFEIGCRRRRARSKEASPREAHGSCCSSTTTRRSARRSRASCARSATKSRPPTRATRRSSASRNASRTWCCSTCGCPISDGLEVLGAIRETNPGCDVIMLTGHGSIDTAIESIRAGAFDYIAKPCPLDELEVRIQRALERQSLRRRASLLERGPHATRRGGLASSARATSSGGCCSSMAAWRRATRPCWSRARPGSGKEMVAKLIHARSARRDRRSWSSSARRCRRACSRASCSATSAGRSPAPTGPSRGCSRWRTAARSSWTRSAR